MIDTLTGRATSDESTDAPERFLRVGLLLDSLVVPAWVAQCVRDIEASGIAQVALVVVRDAPPVPRRSLPMRVREVAPHLLYALYTRFDRWAFRHPDDPGVPVDLSERLADRPIRRVAPRTTKFCDYFEDADADAIDAYDLDVAIRFGFRILKGRALGIARHGVWSYHHGDNLVNRGGPPGFWEVLEGSPTTGSVLQVLTADLDAGKVIYRSWSATDSRSVHRNKRNLYWKTSAFIVRKLRDLAAEGAGALADPCACSGKWEAYSHRLYTLPTNREMATGLARLAMRVAGQKLGTLLRTEEHWRIFYHLNRLRIDTDVPAGTFYRFGELAPPRDRFWADPFPAFHDGRHFLFLEELLYSTGKGHIAACELGADGKWSTPVPVLERDYHMSYPFVFEWQGDWYMIPETSTNRTVELYRAVEFPNRWELARVLLRDLQAVDTTIAEIGSRWWMFVNIAEPKASPWDELHVYHADSPLGPWTPHRRNPVKSDVRSARPAGRLFEADGRWYRPAQDCSIRYGHAIAVHRIERLDDDAYVETEVARVLPSWRSGLKATHTLNAAAGLTVADGWIRGTRVL